MQDDEGDMIEVLKGRASKVLPTLETRRGHELRPVDHRDRRHMLTPREHVKSVQLNIRISPRFKQRLTALAVAKKISVTELLENAFNAYAEAAKK